MTWTASFLDFHCLKTRNSKWNHLTCVVNELLWWLSGIYIYYFFKHFLLGLICILQSSKTFSFPCGLSFAKCPSNSMTCSLTAWPDRWEAIADLTSSDMHAVAKPQFSTNRHPQMVEAQVKEQGNLSLNKIRLRKRRIKGKQQYSKTEKRDFVYVCCSYMCMSACHTSVCEPPFQQVMHLPTVTFSMWFSTQGC